MLPSGLRFIPTDQELISYFLYNKVVAKEPLSPPLDTFVPECNSLFKTEPWVIWDQFGGPNLLKLDQDVYFFTQLHFLGAEDGTGVLRTSHKIESGGTWSRTETEDVEDEEGNIIGLKRHLRYENKGCEHHGKWLLEEYSIPESSKVVLCRLKMIEKASEEFPNQTGKRKHSDFELNLNEREQLSCSNKAVRTESGSSSATPRRPNHDDHVIIIDDDDDEESESPDQFGHNSSLDEWLASLDKFGGKSDEVQALQKLSDDVPLLKGEQLLPCANNYMDFTNDGFIPIGTEQLELPLLPELPDRADEVSSFIQTLLDNNTYWSDNWDVA